jgi:exodeoxyribonuclease VIII
MSEQKLECMLDLETYGRGNKAALISIGATLFLPTGETARDNTFECFVDPQSCVDIGMVVDVSTVNWWMGADCKDDDERAKMDVARRVLAEKLKHAIPIRDALHRFSAWMGEDKPVWGNGATFDNVILRNAYELAGIPCPWEFWNDRCYRTMKSKTPHVKMQRVGVHHSAMWDAISQAEHLQQINRRITISGE